MNDKMDISVVIPAYNSSGVISRAVDSVLKQTCRPLEIIVVDDGSTDDTQEIMRQYDHPVRYIRQPNAGSAAARNTGIQHANAPWIAFLDADDEWLDYHLECHVNLLQRNPAIRWSMSNCYQTDGIKQNTQSDPDRERKRLIDDMYYEDFLISQTELDLPLRTSTTIAHREIFEKAGYFDKALDRAQDTDMWFRIGYVYPKLGYITKPTCIVHLEGAHQAILLKRLRAKSGEPVRYFLRKHLTLARQYGAAEKLKPIARRLLKKTVFTTLYNGLGNDGRLLLREFGDLLSPSYKALARLGLLFPGCTARLLRLGTSIKILLGIAEPSKTRYSLKEVRDAYRSPGRSAD